MSPDFQVAIAGGGPAGAAAALTLARAGRRVVLIVMPTNGTTPIGESLPPPAVPLLRDLGLLQRLSDEGHLPCFGNLSVWGSDQPFAADFLANPYGHGWHLDRGRFDASIREAATEMGAEIRPGRLRLADHSSGRWTIAVDSNSAKSGLLSCDWLIDATGRRSTVARRHGAVRCRDDALVSFHAHFQPPGAYTSDRDSRTMVEATPTGWWYSALLPCRRRVFAFLTDADLVGHDLRKSDVFRELLLETRHLRTLLTEHGYEIEGRPRGAAANGARLDRVAGPGWIAAGDAAISFDPISSQGLLFALDSGMQAGLAVDRALTGDAGSLADFSRRIGEIYAAYRVDLIRFYDAERRWMDQPFWSRRFLRKCVR